MKNLLFSILFITICSKDIWAQSAISKRRAIDSAVVLLDLANQGILDSNLEKSLDYSIKALSMSRISKNQNLIMNSYLCLASSYVIKKDSTEAIQYYKKVLELAIESNDNFDYHFLIAGNNGLGNVYATDPKSLDKAIQHYEEAEVYTLKSTTPGRAFQANINTAILLLKNKKTDRALPFIEKALTNYKARKEKKTYYEIALDLIQSSYHKQKENYSKAHSFIDHALEISKGDEQIAHLIEIYKERCNIYIKEGKNLEAIESLKKLQELKDEQFNTKKQQQIEEISAKFKLNEYENELLIAEQERTHLSQVITFTIVGSILIVILLLLLFKSYKNRKKNYNLQLRNDALLEAKVNAERLTSLKSKFISRVSHELRTPLYGVVGMTSILKEDTTISDKNKLLIDSIKFSGDHLVHLVDNILTINKIDSDEIKLHNKQTNLRDLLFNLKRSFEYQSSEKSNVLELKIGEKVLTNYLLDKLRLSEVLMNLISNAIQNTESGIITITVMVNDQMDDKHLLNFAIKDTGTGIGQHHQKSIYEGFNQLQDAKNTKSGTGLGLTITKSLLELMGSKIELRSEIGKGSTFYFDLLLEKSQDQNTNSIVVKETLTSKNILVVEDNKLSQKITSSLIKLIGHRFKIAENGKVAFELVKDEEFDLILMDLNMPIMNGYDATEKIKIMYPELIIIALTALNINEVKKKCLELGMVDVINKPIGKSKLNEVISRYL